MRHAKDTATTTLILYYISFQISPLELAVETMKSTNKDIRDLIIAHKNDETIPINPLSMKINGIVDPAVMGGSGKYEDAFLTADYLEEHPDDKDLVEELKDLIASQIPLLEIGMSLTVLYFEIVLLFSLR